MDWTIVAVVSVVNLMIVWLFSLKSEKVRYVYKGSYEPRKILNKTIDGTDYLIVESNYKNCFINLFFAGVSDKTIVTHTLTGRNVTLNMSIEKVIKMTNDFDERLISEIVKAGIPLSELIK